MKQRQDLKAIYDGKRGRGILGDNGAVIIFGCLKEDFNWAYFV